MEIFVKALQSLEVLVFRLYFIVVLLFLVELLFPMVYLLFHLFCTFLTFVCATLETLIFFRIFNCLCIYLLINDSYLFLSVVFYCFNY